MKPPRADTVKHGGQTASREQVDELLELRRQVGGLTVCLPDAACPYPNGKRCGYHTQLAAFKGADGKPLRDADQLSPDQIANLIGRYKAQIAKQAARAAETPDIGAVIDLETAKSLRKELALKTEDEAEYKETLAELCGIFGVDDFGELHPDDAKTAMGLLMVRGTPAYEAELAKVREARS